MRMSMQMVGKESIITIEHGNERLDWPAYIFNSTKLKLIDDPFQVINGYWNNIQSPERLDKIWRLYKQAHGCVDGIFEPMNELQVIALELYDLMPLDELAHYVLYKANVIYPPVLRTEYSEIDTNKTLTYLKADYDGLLILAVALRPMVPIFAAYMGAVRSSANSLYKELHAIQILKLTWVMDCPGVNRLIAYIEESLSKNGPSQAAIMKSLGTNKQVEWALANIIIKRLAIGELNANPATGSLISNVFGFVNNNLPDKGNKFGVFFEKIPDKEGNALERSTLELYRTRELISAGQLVGYSKYCLHVLRNAKQRHPMIDESKVLATQEAFPQIFVPTKFGMTITQWVMKEVFPPQAAEYINMEYLKGLMQSAQAILWDWGFPTLALLITASEYNSPNDGDDYHDDGSIRLGFGESEKLIEGLYKHSLNRVGAKRKTNPGLIAIDLLKDMVMGRYWNVFPPEGMEVSQSVKTRGVEFITPQIVDNLSRLILKLEEVKCSTALSCEL